jgi:hypothetical protein
VPALGGGDDVVSNFSSLAILRHPFPDRGDVVLRVASPPEQKQLTGAALQIVLLTPGGVGHETSTDDTADILRNHR